MTKNFETPLNAQNERHIRRSPDAFPKTILMLLHNGQQVSQLTKLLSMDEKVDGMVDYDVDSGSFLG